MEEINKYYTPKIEEFFVGFEYEFACNYIRNGIKQENLWTEDIVEIDTDLELVQAQIQEDIIRVKHLDQSDIEELGWIKHNEYWYHFEDKKIESQDNEYFLNGDFVNYNYWSIYIYDDEENGLILDITDYYGEKRIMSLLIKNKSELKKLMQQLNIIE